MFGRKKKSANLETVLDGMERMGELTSAAVATLSETLGGALKRIEELESGVRQVGRESLSHARSLDELDKKIQDVEESMAEVLKRTPL